MRIGQPKMWGCLILALLFALVWLRPLDMVAEQYTESGLKRAFATFAAARAMNAAISVLQSIQVGVGASIQLGAVLDPIDDLVEQFSAIMLAAMLSFATQRLLIEVAGAWPISAILTVLFLSWGLFRLRNRVPPGWLPRLALGLLCIRLAVPTMALGSEVTYRLLLAGQYEVSQAQIKSTEIAEVEVQGRESLADSFKRWWAQSTDIGKKVEALKMRADGWVEHIVRLAAVFIVQTVFLPLLFLWAMLWLYRVLSVRSGAKKIHDRTGQDVPQLLNET